MGARRAIDCRAVELCRAPARDRDAVLRRFAHAHPMDRRGFGIGDVADRLFGEPDLTEVGAEHRVAWRAFGHRSRLEYVGGMKADVCASADEAFCAAEPSHGAGRGAGRAVGHQGREAFLADHRADADPGKKRAAFACERDGRAKRKADLGDTSEDIVNGLRPYDAYGQLPRARPRLQTRRLPSTREQSRR